MSWRYQPPVLSPVAPAALLTGLTAALKRSRPGINDVAEELRRRYRASDVLLTDSGTSALVLALRMLLPAGGTIACPAYACIDITAAALRAGVRVRLYDLDPTTLSPDLDSVQKALDRRVDAILVAHLYGYPADVRAVKELAEARGVAIIEDAAQAAGGMLGGTPLGALADVSILSFGRGKGVTAGSGGALLTRTAALAQATRLAASQLGTRSRGLRDVVALGAQWLFARSELYRLPASIPALRLGEMVFHPATEPRAISVAAEAMLPMALHAEEHEVSHRRACAKEILGILPQTGGRLAPIRAVAGGESGFLRLAFVDTVGDATPHDSVGVMRGYPLTLDEHEQLQPLLLSGERAGSGARRLRDRLFTAPTHSRVAAADLRRFRQWLARSDSSARIEAFAT
jgi:perosamine synthetase